MLNYRVNADDIEDEYWPHDSEQSGGRVIGEVCHFVDFARVVADVPIEQVYAATTDEGSGLPENVQVTLSFTDGSTAGILYTTLGDSSLPKESVKEFGNGQVGVIDKYK